MKLKFLFVFYWLAGCCIFAPSIGMAFVNTPILMIIGCIIFGIRWVIYLQKWYNTEKEKYEVPLGRK